MGVALNLLRVGPIMRRKRVLIEGIKTGVYLGVSEYRMCRISVLYVWTLDNTCSHASY